MSLFDLTCTCPSCFTKINLEECRIISGRTGQPLEPPAKGLFGRRRVESLDGPYTLELARRECTNDQCRYLLPPNIEKVPGIMLVVVGDTFSGKSHYIAALIHQLKTIWGRNSAGAIRHNCLTPDVEANYIRDYFEPFKRGETLAPTVPATQQYAKPLIYSLKFAPTPKHPTTAINLMIYDASGEDFASDERIVSVSQFVLNTRAFIFVADPFTMTPLFHYLPSHLQTLLNPHFSFGQTRRATDRLNAILSIYGSFRKEEDESFPNTPIAVMVSKSDLFQSLNSSDTYTFMTNPDYGHSIDLQDIDTVDEEVRGLLKTYDQHDLIVATNGLKHKKFFATSASGEPPDANGQFAHVEPCRCLDPVLWILHQLGFVPKK